MSTSIYSMSVVSALERLSKHLDLISVVFADNLGFCKLCDDHHSNPEKKAINAITSITHEENFDGRRLIEEPGLVVLNDRCLKDIKKINELKSEFITNCKSFKNHITKHNLGSPNQELRILLNEAGYLRAHLKQIERMPVIINQLPKSIHWYVEAGGWGKQKKLVKNDIVTMLNAKKEQYVNSGFYELASEKIKNLSNKEVFCIRHKSANTIKASIQLDDGAHNHVGTLPILLLLPENHIDEARKINVTLSKSQTGTKRSRTKFESEPVLEFFNIYRYKEQYQEQEWKNYNSKNL